jgi:hypothetical protein
MEQEYEQEQELEKEKGYCSSGRKKSSNKAAGLVAAGKDTTRRRSRNRNWRKERILNTYIIQTASCYSFSLKLGHLHTPYPPLPAKMEHWVLKEVS